MFNNLLGSLILCQAIFIFLGLTIFHIFYQLKLLKDKNIALSWLLILIIFKLLTKIDTLYSFCTIIVLTEKLLSFKMF